MMEGKHDLWVAVCLSWLSPAMFLFTSKKSGRQLGMCLKSVLSFSFVFYERNKWAQTLNWYTVQICNIECLYKLLQDITLNKDIILAIIRELFIPQNHSVSERRNHNQLLWIGAFHTRLSCAFHPSALLNPCTFQVWPGECSPIVTGQAVTWWVESECSSPGGTPIKDALTIAEFLECWFWLSRDYMLGF